jgi:hypothetical protein
MFMNFDRNLALLKIQLRLYEHFQGKLLQYPSDILLLILVIDSLVRL